MGRKREMKGTEEEYRKWDTGRDEGNSMND